MIKGRQPRQRTPTSTRASKEEMAPNGQEPEPFGKGSVSGLTCSQQGTGRERGCAWLLPDHWGRCDQQLPVGGEWRETVEST